MVELNQKDREEVKDNETGLDYILNLVLRLGLTLAVIIVLCGGILFLWQNSGVNVDYHLFNGEPATLKSLWNILDNAIEMSIADRTLSLIQLGIIVLIATPVMRVVSCLIVFMLERDFVYIFISGFVLIVLLYANL